MGSVRKSVWVGLTLLGMLAAGGCTGVVDSLAFHPQPIDAERAAAATGEGVQEIRITAADGVSLQAFYLAAEGADQAVLFLHGNGGNAYQRLGYARELYERGYSVLLLSYRGYAKSEGNHSEAGVYLDAEAALRYLREQRGFAEQDTFIMGRSIGTAVAIHVAQGRALAGLILVSPLVTGRAVADDIGLSWFSWMAGDAFDSVGKIRNVTSPTLFVHGDQDRLIPIEQGRALFEACPEPKSFQVVQGADHNNVIHRWSWRFWEMIETFLSAPRAMESSEDALARSARGRFRRLP
jgi:fermentation-respiration switch protein FrsA (DUF1100 family)